MLTTIDYSTSIATQKKAARMAGLALLLIIISGVTSNFFIRSGLIVYGDAAATANNIGANEQMFRIAMAGELFMFLADIVLAVALYVVLNPVNKPLAMLGAFGRLANACIAGFAVINSFYVLRLMGDAGYLSAFDSVQLQSVTMLFVEVQGDGHLIGLIFFSFGAAVHSYLLLRSGYIPRILSALYLFATTALLISCFTIVVFPEVLSVIFPWYLAPLFIAELMVASWLAFKGIKVSRTAEMQSQMI